MTSGAEPVGGPLHSAEAQLCCEGVSNVQRLISTNPQQAKKRPWPPWRLIATHAKLRLFVTHSKHMRVTISNRNKKHVSGASTPSRFSDRGPRITTCESRLTAFLIANRILESHLTRSKHRTASPPNREKVRSPRINNCAVGVTWARGAKKKLIAIFRNSKISSSLSKHGTSLFSNRNKNEVSAATNPRLHSLDNRGDALADADAHGAQRVSRLGGMQLARGRGEQASAAGAQRMADGDGAAVGVDVRGGVGQT
jgi:hypothetical protein